MNTSKLMNTIYAFTHLPTLLPHRLHLCPRPIPVHLHRHPCFRAAAPPVVMRVAIRSPWEAQPRPLCKLSVPPGGVNGTEAMRAGPAGRRLLILLVHLDVRVYVCIDESLDKHQRSQRLTDALKRKYGRDGAQGAVDIERRAQRGEIR